MNCKVFILFISILFNSSVKGQTRTLTGKVIDQDFNAMSIASVWSVDTVKLTEADVDGIFSLTLSSDVRVLLIAAVGMEWRRIELTKDCNYLEVVLMFRPTHCFDTPRKVDRLRKKDFEKLAGLHQSAFKKGIFKSEQPCYSEKFISRREGLNR